ncbi:hypothetical protein MAR_003399 [Mya arenaria]|uniref:Uncharacterized protein n=1 Tax=Mya arenaria TaxID=6604 RepID=A0ABY7GF57_MYAAR|nr:hypothetical protein MAR_003399 [Mya arenaria]
MWPGSNIDIVHGQLFKSANRTLNGLLKTQMREGLSLPTKHKSIISNGDLSRLADYISVMSGEEVSDYSAKSNLNASMVGADTVLADVPFYCLTGE